MSSTPKIIIVLVLAAILIAAVVGVALFNSAPPRGDKASYRPIDLSARQAFLDEHRQARARNEAWVNDALQVAYRFTGGSDYEGSGVKADVAYLRNEPQRVELTLRYDGLEDDSVEAIMYLLELENKGGAWEIGWAGERYRCGRGGDTLPASPDRWQTELCP